VINCLHTHTHTRTHTHTQLGDEGAKNVLGVTEEMTSQLEQSMLSWFVCVRQRVRECVCVGALSELHL